MRGWIVVGGLDYGESDRIVRFLTPENGRMDALGRRARASKRRFAGALELGNRVVVEMGKARGSLPVLHSADVLSTPTLARKELERLALLNWGCELCAALAPEGGDGAKLYRLLEVWLELLERDDGAPGAASRLALEAKALTFAGLTPSLLLDARDGSRLGGWVGFSLEAGGGIVWPGHGKRMQASALASLEHLRQTPLNETLHLPPPEGAVHWLLADFTEYHLGRELKSRSMLSMMGSDASHDTR